MNKEDNFVHFMYVPFTGLGLHDGFRGNAWLKKRIEVFKEYVLPSLINQTAQGKFYVWVSWRPEERFNPLVKEFARVMAGVRGIDFIHTYKGVCFWDDKYTDETASERLQKSLSETLPYLKPYVGDAKYVYMTIQPSDDVYTGDAVERIQKVFSEHRDSGKHAVGFRYGYIMDYGTKELCEYSTKGWTTDTISTYRTNTIPPFFTLLFTKEQFLDPEKHYEHTGPYKSHEYVGDFFQYHELEGRGFCVGTHNVNISTTFNHRYKGRTIEGDEYTDLLIKFGILNSRPLVYKRPVRLWMRWILNKLPNSVRHKLLTFYYHKIYNNFFQK